jgi:AmiR/NasT family two-component response regulator
MNAPVWQEGAFRHSLSALALIAMREAGADGYAFFEKRAESPALRRIAERGVPIAEDALDGDSQITGVLAYPLRNGGIVEGVVAFAFSHPLKARDAGARLDRIVSAVAKVWSAAQTPTRYSDLTDRVDELETQLMDWKIGDRARGFLAGSTGTDPAEAIAQHVEEVLRPTKTRQILEKMLRELEAEIESRRVITLAKSILQRSAGMTEEQAHAHLQTMSRRSRKRIGDVALEIIGLDPDCGGERIAGG